MQVIEVRWQTVINSTLPIDHGQRAPLRVRDRDGRHFDELAVQGYEIRQVKAAVQRCDIWRMMPPGEREMKIVAVKMNNVEIGGPFENLFQHQNMVGQTINASLIHA